MHICSYTIQFLSSIQLNTGDTHQLFNLLLHFSSTADLSKVPPPLSTIKALPLWHLGRKKAKKRGQQQDAGKGRDGFLMRNNSESQRQVWPFSEMPFCHKIYNYRCDYPHSEMVKCLLLLLKQVVLLTKDCRVFRIQHTFHVSETERRLPKNCSGWVTNRTSLNVNQITFTIWQNIDFCNQSSGCR